VVQRAMGFTARSRFDDLLLMAVRDYYGLELDLSGVEHEILDDDDERIRFLPWFLWDWRSTGDEPTVGEQFLVTCEHTSLDERLLQGLCDSYVGFFLALETATRSGVWLQDMTSRRASSRWSPLETNTSWWTRCTRFFHLRRGRRSSLSFGRCSHPGANRPSK
jgi:hypothetical protein